MRFSLTAKNNLVASTLLYLNDCFPEVGCISGRCILHTNLLGLHSSSSHRVKVVQSNNYCLCEESSHDAMDWSGVCAAADCQETLFEEWLGKKIHFPINEFVDHFVCWLFYCSITS